MTEKLELEAIGKSKYEVAEGMARTILATLEGKKGLQGANRREYLETVAHCIRALNGIAPN